MGYKRHKCIYIGGNDKQIPDSAFNIFSWLDGIYTQFDPTNAPNGWPDVQQEPWRPEPGPVPPEPSTSSGHLIANDDGVNYLLSDGNGSILVYVETIDE
jgi:hypothetical protein